LGKGNKILAFKTLSAKFAARGHPRHCRLTSSYATDQRNNKVYTCINLQMNFVSSENVNFSTTVLLGIGQLVAIQQLSCHFESGIFPPQYCKYFIVISWYTELCVWKRMETLWSTSCTLHHRDCKRNTMTGEWWLAQKTETVTSPKYFQTLLELTAIR